MKKSVFLVTMALVLAAASANAATLTVSSDQTIYTVGQNITLTVTGDAEGASTTQVFAQVLFSGSGGASTFVSSNQVQQTSFNGGLQWTTGVLTEGAGFADALNQISGLTPVPPDNLFSATIVLQATSVGTLTTSFNQTAGPNQLDFFGVAAPTGGTFTIVVPEPTTAGLLVLGLLSLATVGRLR